MLLRWVITILFLFVFGHLKATSGDEPYRPAFHFSPPQNWLNDPNGLVYFNGEYHMFYQYNPYGNNWGNMSWGHAVSTDLVHWQHLPVAIPVVGNVMAFSGSAVVDRNNTSGFGTGDSPPLVAIYTAADGNQRQNLAYSNDNGRTWTNYAGNPVLNLFDDDFRDPKVFWHEPTSRWIMVVALSARHRIRLYASTNLKDWEFLHDFGNAGDQSGVWECPDLFPLPVDGNEDNVKWVLQVDVAPGKAQYFIGDFDGYRLHIDKYPNENIDMLPEGTLIADFDGDTYEDWIVEGTAFGNAPATNALPGQLPVSGFLGNGLANSFHEGDQSTGVLISPEFTITHPYINLKVGGGNLADDAYVRLLVDGEAVFSATGTDDDFLVWHTWHTESLIGEQAYIEIVDQATEEWGHILVDHIFMANVSMAQGPLPAGAIVDDFESDTYEGWTITGTAFGNGPVQGTLPNQQEVTGFLGNRLVNSYLEGDASQGKMVSQPFQVDSTFISFLIGGGNHPDGTFIRLVVNQQEVRTSTGRNSEQLLWEHWDVEEFVGQTAHIEIVDSVTGGWGHINIDHIIQTNTPPQNDEADYVDHGMDFYAAQSWSDIPSADGRRIWLAWMNNWLYADAVPTFPWKGIMSVPRNVGLTSYKGEVVLTQSPVIELQQLRKNQVSFLNTPVSVIKPDFDTIRFPVFEIKTTLELQDAHQVGFRIKKSENQQTLIWYDAVEEVLYFDRSQSGALTGNPAFARVQSAPLSLEDGKINLHILVDHSSVEIFANDGKVVFSNQIFPDSSGNELEIFAEGDDVLVKELSVWEMDSINTIVSIEEPARQDTLQNIILFPNPVKDEDITLAITDLHIDNILVDVYTVGGTKIASLNPGGLGGVFSIPASVFPNTGLYMLVIQIDKRISVKKVNVIK
ncbi:MAG: GH32 C-terminal domain-containing protein [Bacteroidota bacterium]